MINYKITSPKEKEAALAKPSRIIINNNADKIETKKALNDLDRKIEDIKKATNKKIDSNLSEFQKFKISWWNILERQDQSLISLLTRVTALEIRVDSLENEDMKAKTIDTGLGNKRGRVDKSQLLEALQIAEKLVNDFKQMRKEVFDKLYQITEKELKSKANAADLLEVETKFDERFNIYDKETRKHKEAMRENIQRLQDRMSVQLTRRAMSPDPDFDSSAILSKKQNMQTKCMNCDKTLPQLDKIQQNYSQWKNLPQKKHTRNTKMLHLGKGYSKLLQSYNHEILSPDNSFRKDYNIALNEGSDADTVPFQNSMIKTLDTPNQDLSSCLKTVSVS